MYSKERFAYLAITKGLENASAEEALLKLYDDYYQSGNEDALSDISLYAEKLGKNIALKILLTSSHFKWQDYEEYLQLIAMKLFIKIREERKRGERQKNIVHTIRRFYRLRACDIRDWLAIHYNGETPLSIDDLNETDDGNIRDVIGGNGDPPGCDDELEQEKTELFKKINHMYLANVLDYSDEPQRPIALLYSRILYQLEMRNNPDELDATAQKKVIKDTRKMDDSEKFADAIADIQEPATTTSVKWAMRRMEGQNLQKLSEYAQVSIQEYYSPCLVWSTSYTEALEKPSPYKTGTAWKDIIYTKLFTPKKTSYWSDWLHNYVFDRLVELIEADPELDEEVMRIDSPIKTLMLGMGRGKTDGSFNER